MSYLSVSLHDLNQALFKTAAIRECPFHIYPWLFCLCVAMHDISVVPNRKLSNISLYFVSVFSINAWYDFKKNANQRMIRYIPSPCLCNDACYAPVYWCPIREFWIYSWSIFILMHDMYARTISKKKGSTFSCSILYCLCRLSVYQWLIYLALPTFLYQFMMQII